MTSCLILFIGFTSYRFEKECDRFFKRQEDFSEEFLADQTELSVSRYPIESVSRIDVKRNEQIGWEPVNDVIYIIRHRCIVSLLRPAGISKEQIKLTYTGGYVLPDEPALNGQTPFPPDLEDACIEQTAYFFKNRERLALPDLLDTSDFQQMFDSKSESEKQQIPMYGCSCYLIKSTFKHVRTSLMKIKRGVSLRIVFIVNRVIFY
jgi:hypothetical protein